MTLPFSKSPDSDGIHNDQLTEQFWLEALPYIDFLKGKTLVIKLGGSTLEQQRGILQDILWLQRLGVRPVLVHGGGPNINEWLNKLNIPARFESGLRVTDSPTLDIVRMVLLGQVNQGLVLMAAQMGGRAIGLCGTDGNMVRAHRANERLGQVGEIDAVDPAPIQALLDQKYIPIVAPLGQGPDGTCLNINADPVAAQLAGSLHAEKLIYLSNVAGICRADGSLIPVLDEREARQLMEEGIISGGMIPKVVACLDALAAVPAVHIVNGGEPHIILRDLLTDCRAGTMIRRNQHSSSSQRIDVSLHTRSDSNQARRAALIGIH